jgi:predicted ATPase/tetratricopeptide (TPR) repeat protein/DNA-binding XRE family transcriptional regulator
MATDRSMDFGYLLRTARRSAGLTQEMLAESAGISTRAISDLERGINRAPRRDTLDMLAEALELTGEERSQWERARRLQARRTGDSTRIPASGQAGVHLPAPLTSFVGRENEIERVVDLLQQPDIRLLTVTGPGGVGKTRLSLAVARQLADAYPDGVWFVDLAPLNDPALVLPTLAATLGIKLSANQPALDAISESLESARALLIIDNVEHVLDAALQIRDLIRACPKLTVLATSRAPLQVQGEREYPLEPLGLPGRDEDPDLDELLQSESIALFMDRARAVRPDFTLNMSNAAIISAICHQLEGVPLAIELAAAHVRILSPQAMVRRLEHRLPLLAGGRPDLPLRQQTLRNAIAWSYDLLPPESQRLFQLLAVFRGGWTLEAAEAVFGDGDVFSPLERLVEHSLVRVREQPNGEPRYSMLETIREYGLERLADNQLDDLAHSRHGWYFLEFSEHAIPSWRRHTATDPYGQMRIDQDNLRAALSWFMQRDTEAACRLSGALWRFFALHGDVTEGRRWLEMALDRSEGLSPAIRARIFEGITMMAYMMVDHEAARINDSEALRLWNEAGDRSGIALTLHGYARLAYESGDFKLAEEYCSEMLALYRELGDPVGIADAINVAGIIAMHSGDVVLGRQRYEESLLLRRQAGDWFGLSQSLRNLGQLAMSAGEYDRARSLFEESLALAREYHLGGVESDQLLQLGLLAFRQGDPEHARDLATESIRLSQNERRPFWILQCLMLIARIDAHGGALMRVATIGGAIESIAARGNLPTRSIGQTDPDYDRTIAEARSRVSAIDWEAAWSQGTILSLADAVEFAIQDDQRSDS